MAGSKFYKEEEQSDQGHTTTSGDCPVCGTEEGFVYGQVHMKLNTVTMNWICGTCQSQGEEVYDIEFAGHKVNKENSKSNRDD